MLFVITKEKKKREEKKMAYTKEQSFKDLELMLQNEHYYKYYQKKLNLREQYPKWNVGGTDDCRNYIREVGHLLAHDKDFQAFIWDYTPQYEKSLREVRARGRKQGGTRKSEFNYY